MTEFTFAVTSYNQENYILEHLESIKYQILEFGQNYDIHLVVSDDNSTDKTLEYCKFWTEKFSHLFTKITINKNELNRGIVGNYVKCTELIETKHFKMLDGDDLYYFNNVFELIDLSDFVITYPVNLKKNRFYFCFDKSLFSKKKESIKRRLIESTDISNPGIFTNIKLLKIRDLREIIADYKMLADYPMWTYLFVLSNLDFKHKALSKRYVIYRQMSGITSKKSELAGSTFMNELENFSKKYSLLEYSKSKYYKFYKFILINKYIFRISYLFQKTRDIFRISEKKSIAKYYKMIQDYVELFKSDLVLSDQ